MIATLAIPAALLLSPFVGRQALTIEKYQLQNGLTVILHEDHSFPQACINLWFRVGSKDEEEGRSGFAHLFEHLMFMGTERAPGADFDLLMEAGGGWNNASTSEDRTNYYSSGPAELLPLLLWLDADRLEDLGRMMTLEKLDAQRAVVRNERRQTSENVPYGKAELASVELLFPEGHPYHHTVIGSHEDLEAATLKDVQEFFATYYVPNNASLVVAGDFDPNTIKPLIDSLFGSLPRGNDALHKSAKPVVLDEELVHTMVDTVQFAKTSLIWHSPAAYQPGDAELDLIATLLTDGIASRLSQRLVVREELALEVNARQSSMLLGSTFTIEALARPGVPLKAIEIAIDEVLSEFRRSGPSEEELARAKINREAALRAGMETIQARADALNAYEFHFGDPASFERDLQRFLSATPESVRAAAERTLGWRGRLVLRVLPQAETSANNPRDRKPTVGAAAPFLAPPSEQFTLPNGIQVVHWPRPGAPTVELLAISPFGSACDPAGRTGLAQMAAEMLDEGAGGRDAAAFGDALQALGASLSARVDPQATELQLSSLRRTFRGALQLAADAIQRPMFSESEWSRVHSLHQLDLEAELDSAPAVANRIAWETYFGREHPFGRPVRGRPADVQQLSLGDVASFHHAIWQPAATILLVGGDISTEELKTELSGVFGSWQSQSLPYPTPAPITEPASTSGRVILVHRPEAVQTVVGFLMPAPSWHAPERPAWELLTTILGGSFTSRLNQNLREKNGYTYGARASYRAGTEVATLWANSAVRTDVTGAALKEFLGEFRAIRSGNVIPAEEQKARATWRRSKVEQVASVGSLLQVASDLLRKGQGLDVLATEYTNIERLREGDLNALAGEYVPHAKGVLVLVGDEAKILPQLADLGLPTPEHFAPDGTPLSPR